MLNRAPMSTTTSPRSARLLQLSLVTAIGLSASAAEAASRCPPGTRTPAAIAWWVVVPFFLSLAISAPMFAALTKSEQGRLERLLATVGVFVTGFAITVGLLVWQVTRCVPV